MSDLSTLLDETQGVNRTPDTRLSPIQQQVQLNQLAAENPDLYDPRFSETATAAVQTGWLASWVLRDQLGKAFGNWIIEDEWSAQTASPEQIEKLDIVGLNQRQVNRIYDTATFGHAQAIRGNMRKEAEYRQVLENSGVLGTVASIAAEVFDPTVLGALVATEGAVAPWVLSAKVGRVANIFRGGAVGFATEGTVEGALSYLDPERNPDDLPLIGLAAMGLGGLYGALGKRDASYLFKDHATVNTVENTIENVINKEAAELGKAEVKVVIKGDEGFDEHTISVPEPDQVLGQPAGATTAGYRDTFITPSKAEALRNAEAARPDMNDVWAIEFNMYARNIRSKNPLVAVLQDIISPNPTGVRLSGKAQAETAFETKEMLFRTEAARTMAPLKASYDKWATRNDVGVTNFMQKREQFMTSVGKQVRDPKFTSDADVMQAADAIRASNERMRQLARTHGVKGFEDIETNPTYLMRVPKYENMAKLDETYGPRQVERLIAEGIKRGRTEPISDEAALARAMLYRKWINDKQFGVNQSMALNFNKGSENALRKQLVALSTDPTLVRGLDELPNGDAIAEAMRTLDEDDIDSMVELIRGSGRSDITKRAEKRINFDESTSLPIYNTQTGATDTVRLDDLFESNAERLFVMYAHQMGGQIGFAKQGIKSPGDWDAALQRVRATAAETGMTPDELEGALGRLEVQKRAIVGEPTTDAEKMSPKWRNLLRTMRDYQFSRVMNQVGWAQVAEYGTASGQMGWGMMAKQMPILGQFRRDIDTGKVNNDFIEEIDAIFGTGVDRLLNLPSSRADGDIVPDGLEKLGGLQAGLQVAKRVTGDISGLMPITIGLERMAVSAAVHRFAKDAISETSSLSSKRLLSIGLDERMTSRIMKEMKSSVVTEAGDLTGQIKTLGFDKWKDLEARDAFRTAIFRWSRRAIQRNDIGDLPEFMTTEMARTLFQFKSFAIVSFSKQLIHGLRMADAQTASSFLGSTLFGGLAYMAQTHVRFADDPDERERRLTPEAITAASFSRSSFSSLIPTGVDSALGFAGQDPLFSLSRGSGLTTGFSLGEIFTSNPSMDSADLLTQQLVPGIARAIENGEAPDARTLNAARRLLIWQNATGVENALRKTADILGN